MAQIDKTLEKWENAESESWDTVSSVLKRYGFVQKGNPTGSHYAFTHPVLAQLIKKFPQAELLKPYGPDGRIMVIRNKKQVQGYILERIREAIIIINDFYRLDDE